MLTCQQWGSVSFTWEQFHSQCPSYWFCIMILKVKPKIIATSPRGQLILKPDPDLFYSHFWVNSLVVLLVSVNPGRLQWRHCRLSRNALQWCHNENGAISNDGRLNCLLNRSGADKKTHKSSASLAFVRGIHWWLMDSPHKGKLCRKCFHLMTSLWTEALIRWDESRVALWFHKKN